MGYINKRIAIYKFSVMKRIQRRKEHEFRILNVILSSYLVQISSIEDVAIVSAMFDAAIVRSSELSILEFWYRVARSKHLTGKK